METRVPVDFVEVISENFMVPGGRPRDILRRVRQDYPVALHGVSMSVGSADGLRLDYLLRLKALIAEIEPFILSDHLCWTRHGAHNSHDLLPLPYTREALDVVCANVGKAQDVLGREMLIENPSSYIAFADNDMGEWDFLAELTRRTGCGLLLDVNNIHVSATNHGFSSADYLAGIPFASVDQIHLAGHTQGQHCLIDTHDRPVPDPVWALLRDALARAPRAAVMIERDDAIPPLPELLAELALARDIASQVVASCA
ncbi:MNIO family bufferin maturase [Novosphingobium sp. KACC 22771]|uniref:MNIO family bufferin maturase n=1 Tax=Novosphingobium sp. KACC 22771 TaxID=3025670 RepID=UPI002365CA30|nr:DUF692 domain-containing protein [Novosphingobium sp. KACC 22771]WDF74139.1 DUF692 domain-containing protein [Novosphingobium sp. KACC 22771]